MNSEEMARQEELDALLRDSILSEEIDSSAIEQRVRARIASERRFALARKFAVAAGLGAILLAGAYFQKPARLFADAARDHHNEIVGRQPRHWLIDPKAIGDLAQRHGIQPALIVKITPPGYRLVEAKLCRLDGRVFLHLVYAQDAAQFSTYLRALDGQPLPGGKFLHEVNSGHEHVASFQTGALTALFVTDQSDAAALSFARSAARQL